MLTLRELVEALAPRIPQLERIEEAEIIANAIRLRASAMQRLSRPRQTEQPMFFADRQERTAI